tara:strand:+ start:5876 stop:6196 length:321 start_codon:yes stop_codon:yes gene_type:complete
MGKLSKAKKLTKTEKFCIEGMLSNDMSVSEVCKTLDRDQELVEAYVEELEQAYDQGNTAIINETLNGNKGVAIMTEAASQRIDEARNEHSPTENRITKTSIHQINK